MQERWWMACCAAEVRNDVEMAVRQCEPGAKVIFAMDAEALRSTLAEGTSRDFAVAVGATTVGVSDINLAAAIVRDGVARRVVLVGHNVSGSVRSRATRAGIDEVIDIASSTNPLLREVPENPDPTHAPATRDAVASAGGEGLNRAAAARVGEGSAPSDHRRPAVEATATGARMASGDQAAGKSPVLAVASGRGGVGKTTVAALSALVAASWGMHVALVDADLCCGNLFTLFGLDHAPALDAGPAWAGGTRVHAAEQAEGTLDGLLSRGQVVAPGVTLWGPCDRPEMAEKVSPALAGLFARLSERYDLVVVDTSTTCTDAGAQACQACDRLLLVHDENQGAIGSLARMASLAVRLGVARTQIVRVANWGDRRVRFDLSVGRGELGLETARAFRLLDGGEMVTEALLEGKATDLVGRGGEPVDSLSQALARILDELGALPDAEGARQALEETHGGAKKFHLWGRKVA